jgi:hypothetical protein
MRIPSIAHRSRRFHAPTRPLRLRLPCLVLACLLASGCGLIDWLGGRGLSRDYCEQHADDKDCRDKFPDADTGCTSNASCAAPTGVCDLAGARTCVQCIAPDQTSACDGVTPTCGTDHTCHACSKHEDCPASNVCLPDGSCAAAAQVAYVDPVQGSGNSCALSTPCKKVKEALDTSRPYLKLTGTIDEQVQIDQSVTILATPGARLTRTNPGVILEVRGASVVEIVDLTIADGLGGTGIGISLPAGNSASLALRRVSVTGNTGGGLVANGSALAILQSTISGNTGGGVSVSGGTLAISQSTISGNTAGGISVTGGTLTISRSTIRGPADSGITVSGAQFDITNTIIAGNGGPATAIGGVRFDQTNSGNRRFEFNTVTNNNGMDGAAVGVVCTLVGQPVTFANNIVYANQEGGTRTQVGGANCNWKQSDIGPVTVPGTGNINMDPRFANPAQSNFHLQAGSPAADQADPASTMDVDIDGDVRPQGNGRDMGADEAK